MKSLIEKIIDTVNTTASNVEDNYTKLMLGVVVEKIQEIEDSAEFEEVARVMMKHLCVQVEKYHPHHTVIVTGTTCELVEGVKTVGKIMDYVVD